jgi:hypothetical protein
MRGMVKETASKWQQQLLLDANTTVSNHSNRFRHIRSRLFYDYFLSTFNIKQKQVQRFANEGKLERRKKNFGECYQ